LRQKRKGEKISLSREKEEGESKEERTACLSSGLSWKKIKHNGKATSLILRRMERKGKGLPSQKAKRKEIKQSGRPWRDLSHHSEEKEEKKGQES